MAVEKNRPAGPQDVVLGKVCWSLRLIPTDWYITTVQHPDRLRILIFVAYEKWLHLSD